MESSNSRTAALLGKDAMSILSRARVLIVGVGGVGGWCAEALARSGVGNLTIVDDDTIVESNLNRQCAATVATLGRVKVEAMAERLAAVNPDCHITALNLRYPNSSHPSHLSNFSNLSNLSSFTIIADAIDSVDCKAELILNATESGVPLVSSMGAALRLDPTRVRISSFDKVTGDGLARALRQRFKRLNRYPKNFTAIWSDEPPVRSEVEGQRSDNGSCHPLSDLSPLTSDLQSTTIYPLPSTNSSRGSIMPVVATFGMCMAAEVLKKLVGGAGLGPATT